MPALSLPRIVGSIGIPSGHNNSQFRESTSSHTSENQPSDRSVLNAEYALPNLLLYGPEPHHDQSDNDRLNSLTEVSL